MYNIKVFPVEISFDLSYIFGSACYSMVVLNKVRDCHLQWKMVTCATFRCLKNDYHIIELAEYEFCI